MEIQARDRQEKSNKFFPQFTSDFEPEKQPPYFSFRYLTDSHCITKCTKDEKASFAVRMLRISKLSWGELKLINHHKLGYELIPRNSLKVHIPPHVTDDVKKFVVFRFHDLKPMIGYRQNVTFYVLWFDAKMNAYDHG